MDIQTATPETGTVDAPASMEDVLSEFEAGGTAPVEATEAAVQELVEEAEEGHSGEEADAEGDATDANDTGEETAEEEPREGEDEPEPAFKVKVAGEEVEVPLSELVKGYSREQDYTRKTMALAEERKSLQSQFANELKQQVEVFKAMDPVLADADKIDWQRLAMEDPATYVQLKAAVDERRAIVTAAEARIREAQVTEGADPELATKETEALIAKVPELADPAAMGTFAQNAVSYLRDTGFEDGEIAELTDHRALLIIDKARRFDALEKAKAALPAKKVVPKPAVKPLRSDGTSSSPAPNPRFPANAPRELRLDHVVKQLLKE